MKSFFSVRLIFAVTIALTAAPALADTGLSAPDSGLGSPLIYGASSSSAKGAIGGDPGIKSAGRHSSGVLLARSSEPATLLPNPVPKDPVAQPRQMDPKFLPAEVDYDGNYGPDTIVVDTHAKYIYYVEGNGKALRFGIGSARPGFEWSGSYRISRKAEWPTWTPPAEMHQRQSGLPIQMAGGEDNPLGARAMYIGNTLYRVHGTNMPWTIGQSMSSGCIRMRNEDVIELYKHVKVGTRIVIM